MNQPFAQQPQMNPNNFMMQGPPADVGTASRPTGWPGAPPPQQAAPPQQTNRQPAAPGTAVPGRVAPGIMAPGTMMPGTMAPGAPLTTAALAPGAIPAAPGSMAAGPGAALLVPPGAPAGAAAAKPLGQSTEDERSMQFDLLDLDGARVIARVGPEVIQDNEVRTYVDDLLERNAGKIPPQQLDKIREKLLRDRLNHLIEIKLAIVDAQRKVPRKPIQKFSRAWARTSSRRKFATSSSS